MFHFFAPFAMTYNFVLVIAAVVPAVILMIRVYRSDRLEKEPPSLLISLAVAGVLSSLIALVAERFLCFVLDRTVSQDNEWYNYILYFGIVAFSEEGAKYFMLKRKTWSQPFFNCQYDGVVYAVFVSLGFALWENISYVMSYGFSTAVLRALTAIPGHACFGVFMGVFYGIAKRLERGGSEDTAGKCRILCVLVPALIHGAYDYIATYEDGSWYFACFVLALFAISFVLVGKMAKNDRYI